MQYPNAYYTEPPQVCPVTAREANKIIEQFRPDLFRRDASLSDAIDAYAHAYLLIAPPEHREAMTGRECEIFQLMRHGEGA